VIDEGVTGHVVDTVEQAIEVLPQTLALDRRAIRAVFDERFTAARMARDYVKLYRRILKKPAPNEAHRINGVGAGPAPQIQLGYEAN
jgi:hypothetical protein